MSRLLSRKLNRLGISTFSANMLGASALGVGRLDARTLGAGANDQPANDTPAHDDDSGARAPDLTDPTDYHPRGV